MTTLPENLEYALIHAVNASGLDAQTATSDYELASKLLSFVQDELDAADTVKWVNCFLSNPEVLKMVLLDIRAHHPDVENIVPMLKLVVNAIDRVLDVYSTRPGVRLRGDIQVALGQLQETAR